MNGRDERDEQITLELLEAIGKDSSISQRFLARKLGVALGLANSYLKRCMRKGLVKISDAPANRYLYYLTPMGFTEKSRLTAKYLKASFSFYRQASDSCRKIFQECATNDWGRVVLCGVSDLAEIASLRSLEANIKINGFYDPDSISNRFLDKTVWHEFIDVPQVDAYVLTDLDAPMQLYEALLNHIPSEQLLVPDILRLEVEQVVE